MTVKHITYEPNEVCSKKMEITIEDGIIKEVNIIGGCTGNASGIKALIEGQKVEDVKERIKGIKCGFKQTSCPDQLAKALEEIK